MSCGMGACEIAVGAATRGLTERAVEVAITGGLLDVTWDGTVLLTGPAVRVADGDLRNEWRHLQGSATVPPQCSNPYATRYVNA